MKRDNEEMMIRMKNSNAKIELSKELELTVLRQENIMNGYLEVIDDLHLSCAAMVEELKHTENARMQTYGDIIFQSVIKLKDFEETYMKTNSLIYALCYSNKKRGDTVLDLIQKLRSHEEKEERLEEDMMTLESKFKNVVKENQNLLVKLQYTEEDDA